MTAHFRQELMCRVSRHLSEAALRRPLVPRIEVTDIG